MRRIAQLAGYTFSAIGIVLLILWAIRGARPALECGIGGYLVAQDWGAACACLDKLDYEAIIGFVTLVSGGLLSLFTRLAPDGDKSKEYNPTPEERTNNRKELIRRVKKIWIDGYLNQSLLPAAMWQLGLEWNPADPPPAPYGMKAKRQNQTPLDLAAGPQMVTFYEQVDHRLLILGAPGAGKTTVMLDLAKSYLDQAERDATVHIPVIFTLSSWPVTKTPFDDWLVSEMRLQYGTDITDKVARYWLEHNEIALFLDGLDELPEDRRDDTVAEVKAYCETVFDRWYVVCSRSAEYVVLANGFTELDSVEIEPVTPAQIQGYLAELDGEQPRQLAATIAGDETLQEVADTPLMLNVMLLAADAVNWSELPTDKGADVARAFIYDAYVEEMLVRQRRGKQYAAAKTLKWLQWLAQKMVDHDQTVFLLERMNRSWFNQRQQRYVWVSIFGLVGWLIFVPFLVRIFKLIFGLVFGLTGGFGFGLIIGSFFGLIFGLVFGLTDFEVREYIRLKLNRRGMIDLLSITLFIGLVGGLGIGLVSGLGIGLVGGLSFVLLSGLGAVLFFELLDSSSTFEQSYNSSQPNYAIRQSLRNALALGLIGGLSFGLIFGLVGSLVGGPVDGLANGLVGWLSIVLLFGLPMGLEAAIKHYTLRLVLFLDGSMPLNYVRFLDACADRILLRKVGGGYMFPHITFRDYFTALTPERIDALAQRVEARKAIERRRTSVPSRVSRF